MARNAPGKTHRQGISFKKLMTMFLDDDQARAQSSNLGYRDWAITLYLLTTNLKGVSAMKLHRDLDIACTTAWHLAHRLREAFAGGSAAMFHGPGEADET